MSEKNHLPISGGKAVVECLKAHNIKYVFGLIGSATMELFDALYDEHDITFIDVRDGSLVSLLAGVKKRILRVGMPILPKLNLAYRASFKLGLSHFVAISSEIFSIFDKSKLIEPLITDTIPNGIDVDQFDFKLRSFTFDKNGPVFGNCVRLTDQKGLFNFLDIIKAISLKVKNATFLLAGSGELEIELKSYAKKIGIEEKVNFLGHVEDVSNFYPNIDFLLFTSKYEGTARTIIEAMSCGALVFCYDTSSMAEMIDNNTDGYKVTAFDKDEFISSIFNALDSNSVNLVDMAKRARYKTESHFSKSKNFNQWKDFILFN